MPADHEVAQGAPVAVDSGPGETRSKPALSRTGMVVGGVIGLLLLAWFFVAWLLLDRHVVDAVGESVGGAFAILLLVSLFGAFRPNGRRS